MRGAFAFSVPHFLSPVIHPQRNHERNHHMFFPFLAATIVGAGAVKLGAMSTMVSVLSLALQALILANLIGAGYFLWRHLRGGEQ
jgi:ABC-type hemin transport system ATPase subunit